MDFNNFDFDQFNQSTSRAVKIISKGKKKFCTIKLISYEVIDKDDSRNKTSNEKYDGHDLLRVAFEMASTVEDNPFSCSNLFTPRITSHEALQYKNANTFTRFIERFGVDIKKEYNLGEVLKSFENKEAQTEFEQIDGFYRPKF